MKLMHSYQNLGEEEKEYNKCTLFERAEFENRLERMVPGLGG